MSEFLPDSIKMTPMLKQWSEAKAKAKDAVLLFRMGDFYELFADDAVNVAPVLELALTSRDKDKGDAAVPMAGFPHHAAPQHIAKLVAAGFKVAICDQLEDPKLAKGIVKRDITQIVTPGTVIEDDALTARENNFLVSVTEVDNAFGVAALDWSTGEFKATRISSLDALCDEVMRLAPSELLVSFEGSGAFVQALSQAANRVKACRVEKRAYSMKIDRSVFAGHLDPYFDTAQNQLALNAAAQLIAYVDEAQGGTRGHVGTPRPYSAEEFLLIDAISQRHLNLVAPRGRARKVASLVGSMDATKTAMGSRLLHAWITAPSTGLEEIGKRHDAVEAILERPDVRGALQDILASVYDLERLTAKAAIGRLTPRELGCLRDSLLQLPNIKACTETIGERLKALAELETMHGLATALKSALSERPPMSMQEGGIFAQGYDAELDEITLLADGGRDQIAQVEAREREAHGIASLKVGYTRVFGYYIEVTRTHLSKVPEHYRRKQTIATGERYITEELMRLEELIATAQVRKQQRESMLFEALRQKVAEQAQKLLACAKSVARIDVACAFAEVAQKRHYARPTMLPMSDAILDVKQGRHPIIEILARESCDVFVPNDIFLDKSTCQIMLITGPNMAGKSTIMRQTALIQILAQAGSFVPADAATLSVCDRIFTRVGASDDIDEGRSTFMVEMSETAQILKHATSHSLVLLDEIGRGTSTYDGLSVAWAVAEYMHDIVLARTLFATHYHELTQITNTHPRIRNLHVAVDESARGIEFLYLLREGGATRSYGIHVAELAGIPKTVLARAHAVLATLEKSGQAEKRQKVAAPQLDLFGERLTEIERKRLKVAEELALLDLDNLTPLGAINWLHSNRAQVV